MSAWHEATWTDPDEKAGRRRFRWGWLWLLLIPLGLIFFSVGRANNYWQYDDFTVVTFSCPEPLSEDASWADMEAAGCAPNVIPGIDVRLLEAGRPSGEVITNGATWEFHGMQSAFSTLAINVYLEEPAGRVFIVDAAASPPRVHREMTNSDEARTVFARNLGEIETLDFYVVVSPAE